MGLAAGLIVWIAAAAVTLAGFFWARHELPEPRPAVLVDAVHAHP